MNWIILSILSAFSETIKDTFGKISSTKFNEYTAAISLHIFTIIFTLPIIIYQGIPTLTQPFWMGSLAFLMITPTWSILYMKALKLSPLSTTLPMMAFNPIFTAFLAFFFTKEIPNIYGWLGLFLISLGIYFINMDYKILKKDFLHPLKNIIKDKGALYMLAVALIWSFGAHFSKLRVDGSNPMFSTFTGGLIGITTTYILAFILKKKISWSDFIHHAKDLTPVGIFYYLATYLSSVALKEGTATYVFALKRSSIVLSAISGKLFFKEKLYWNKYLGIIIVFLGILLISI